MTVSGCTTKLSRLFQDVQQSYHDCFRMYNKGIMTVSGQPADPAGPVSPADPDTRPGRISGK